jgi:HSP20 family protein
MNLIPWRNGNKSSSIQRMPADEPFRAFRTEMDRLFDRFLGEFDTSFGDLFTPTGEWVPAFDVAETDDAFTVRAEIPGVDPKDVEITVAGNILTVAGEKSDKNEERGRGFFRSERCFGSFRRSIQLPATVDTDKVKAEHANGVVTIRLAKSESATPSSAALRKQIFFRQRRRG